MNCQRCTADISNDNMYAEADLFCMNCGSPNNIIICINCIEKDLKDKILCTTCEMDMFHIPATIKYLKDKDEEDIS